MSNIRKAFENGKAFIPFITCGDPDLKTTGKIVREAVKNGADLIELGIPFSDPTAEGPVIQGANIRALAGGVTTDKIFEFCAWTEKGYSYSACIYDICECGIFLRCGKFHFYLCRNRN